VALVQIDTVRLSAAIGELRAVASVLRGERDACDRACQRAPYGTGALAKVPAIAEWLEGQIPQLQARIDLIRAMKGDARFDGAWLYELANDDTATVKEELGRKFAELARRIDYDTDTGAVTELKRRLAPYSKDPDAMRAFFTELGPKGTLEFLDRVGSVGHDEHGLLERRALAEQVRAGLETASGAPGFPAVRYARDLVRAVPTVQHGGPALSFLLYHSHYATPFLSAAGDELDQVERQDQKGRPGLWAMMAGGPTALFGGFARDDAAAGHDVMTSLMGALGRNKQASLDFFTGNPEARDRQRYYIQDRTWSADEFNALGEALDAGSTSYRDPADPRALRAAELASATVHFLAARDGDPKIGDRGKDSLGHILATYIVDVDRIAATRSDEAGVPGAGTFKGDEHLQNLPPGAFLDVDDLKVVMRETLTDKGAVEQVANAARTLNAARFAAAADLWATQGKGEGEPALRYAMSRAGSTTGFVWKQLGLASIDEGAEQDARVRAWTALASDTVAMVPLPGAGAVGKGGEMFIGFLADQATSQGKDYVTGRFATHGEAAWGRANNAADTALKDVKIGAVKALADRNLLPAGDLTDNTGTRYPWVDAQGRLRPQQELDRMTDLDKNSFQDWVGTPESGIAGVTADVNGAFLIGLRNYFEHPHP
jgi:hypothetical protein